MCVSHLFQVLGQFFFFIQNKVTFAGNIRIRFSDAFIIAILKYDM